MQSIIRLNASAKFMAGGTTILIEDLPTTTSLRIEFDGLPAAIAVDQLDKLAAAALEIRGRLLRELASDEDS